MSGQWFHGAQEESFTELSEAALSHNRQGAGVHCWAPRQWLSLLATECDGLVLYYQWLNPEGGRLVTEFSRYRCDCHVSFPETWPNVTVSTLSWKEMQLPLSFPSFLFSFLNRHL